ncbi:MAG: gliding motility-associated C-terminal domain-containing protein [Owenweeksia sp.]
MKQFVFTIFFTVCFALSGVDTFAQKTIGGGTSQNPGVSSVNTCQLFVPNAFTPNGDDTNDQFIVKYNGECIMAEYAMKVFDRWGRLVYETKEVDPSHGWDGKSEGRDLKEGVYMWRVYAKLVDPSRNYEAQLINKQGSVVLIR